MSKVNSIWQFKYLFFFIILLISGCSEKNSQHSLINQNPIPIDPSLNKVSINYHALKKENCPIPAKSSELILPKNTHNTVWDRLLSLYMLPEINNERVDAELIKYLAQPQFLSIIQQRAEPYLYFILDQIEKNQLPGELALLPAVESAFKPTAVSSSNASGLWQFMPATGRLFGLKQNWWYDGRNDICTSTQAATTYLKQLGSQFDNDWLLALASYNAGRGTIRKAIRKNSENDLATDYWSLSLSKETMNYVPRLLALAKIFANSEYYNITLNPIPNQPFFTVVSIDSQLDLQIAAEMADIPFDDFYQLNSGFKRTSSDPDGPYHLLVHVNKAESFKKSLDNTAKKNRVKWFRHKILAGENLSVIAKMYNTSVNALRQSNHLNNNNIRAGKFLLIPSVTKKLELSNDNQLYIVKKGDTIWNIALQFDVSSQDIAYWNDLTITNTLYPGQKLLIKKLNEPA